MRKVMIMMMVDLPHPDSPTKAIFSPVLMDRFSLLSTWGDATIIIILTILTPECPS